MEKECQWSIGRGRKACWPGSTLPDQSYFETGRVDKCLLPGMAPASQALFSIRQGVRSLLARNGSCPGSFFSLSGRIEKACRAGKAPAPRSSILNPAGCEKLAGQGRLLPHKPYSQSGRVRRACRPGIAPAPQALFSIRQGARSLPAGDSSCPASFILNPAGCEELAGQGCLLPYIIRRTAGGCTVHTVTVR